MDSPTLTVWTGPFPVEGIFGLFSFLPCFIEILVFNAKSVDHDQMPLSELFANAPFKGRINEFSLTKNNQ